MGRHDRTRDRVARALGDAIRQGHYRPGDRLPSETVIADLYAVHRLTARAALSTLAAEGLVHPEARRGWYVTDNQPLIYPLTTIDKGGATARKDVWMRFLDSVQRTGDVVLTGVTLDAVPPASVADGLRLTGREPCLARHRIRRIEGVPVMRSVGYYPLWLARGTVLTASYDQQDPPPLATLARLGHGVVRDIDMITARMPTTGERSAFAMPPGTPVLVNTRTSHDRHGTPVRCTVDVLPAHRFVLSVDRELEGAAS